MKREPAFSLITTITAASIILIGSAGLAFAISYARSGSSRQQHSAVAQEVAEAGMAETINQFNTTYRYLLVENLSSWSEVDLQPSTICPGAFTNSNGFVTSDDIKNNSNIIIGSYRLKDYSFNGSRYYGGTGTLKVEGTAKNSNGSTIATATITQQIDVRPKNCNSAFNNPPTSSGFPGLLATDIDLGNNDVLGTINGNVLCMSCSPGTNASLRSQMGMGPNSVVNGSLFAGSIPLPPIPDPPSGLPANPIDITETTTITAGPSTNTLYCIYESPENKTFCKVANIDLSGGGKALTFDMTNGPIYLYSIGNINISGNASLRTIVPANSIDVLTIYGKSSGTQTVTLNGGATAMNLFMYMPVATVGINGGSANPDILGAVWVKNFNGSNSNNAEILVPNGMGGLLTDTQGSNFNVSIRDFTALGTKAWSARDSQ